MVALTLGIVFFQYLISPFIIGWIYRIDWIPYDYFQTRYPHLAEAVNKVVSFRGIKTPRLGIIHDMNPNAFTFGHTKNNARIVITDGILNYLDEKEQKAVVAHELGHVVHSDFILMTVVFAIPLVLLTIARWAFYTSWFSGSGARTSRGEKEGLYIKIALLIIAALSFVAYYVAYLISLIISRTREYYADQHAAELTENPNALATGLVKIAYGLLVDRNLEERNRSKVRALKGLGIFDPSAAKAFAISSVGPSGKFSRDAIQAAAAWDLFNPWAKYYQIFSTHPLPAKRILRLNEQCKNYGLTPEIDFSGAKKLKEEQAGKSMIDEFLVDLTIMALPTLVFIALVGFTIAWFFGFVGYFNLGILPFANNLLLLWAIGFYIIGFGSLFKTRFKYKSGFEPKSVLELVTNVKVSPIRTVPAVLEGKIVGKGIPGYYFSDDLYFQDNTGLMYIDYRFGLSIVDFFWAILKVKQLIGQSVRIKGWYRRGPSPYLQVDTIETEMGKRYRNYSKHVTYIWAVLAFLIGLLLFYLWFLML
jgi:Zn-dependent protease with chaperone function